MREQGKKNCCRCSKRKPVFLLFLSILLMQAGYSQNLSLNVKKAPLESVFREIESQVPQRFVYTREMLKDSKPVTIQMEHAPLQKILEQVFKGQPLVFEADASFIKVRYRGANEAVVQEHEIRGVVYGENGTPLAGATILLKKKNQATVTDPNGRFSFKSADENEVLLVTFTGYESKEIAVKGRSDFNIHLEVFVKPLDETVVIAYGSTTRRLNTGSVTKVSGEEIERQPVSNPIAALQGRVPGLVINQSSGVAGSVFKVEIRGGRCWMRTYRVMNR